MSGRRRFWRTSWRVEVGGTPPRRGADRLDARDRTKTAPSRARSHRAPQHEVLRATASSASFRRRATHHHRFRRRVRDGMLVLVGGRDCRRRNRRRGKKCPRIPAQIRWCDAKCLVANVARSRRFDDAFRMAPHRRRDATHARIDADGVSLASMQATPLLVFSASMHSCECVWYHQRRIATPARVGARQRPALPRWKKNSAVVLTL